MERLAILGKGVLGQHIAHVARAQAAYEVVGFFDDFAEPGSQTTHGPVLGPIEDAAALHQDGHYDRFICGIGYRHRDLRARVFDEVAAHVPPASVVHPSCVIDPSASIDAGSFLLPGCLVDMGASIGLNVLLHVGCCVSHDAKVGAHSFFAPRVALAGFVEVGKQCFIGINTTVIDGIAIGDRIQTGGGTVVTKDLAEPGLYVGAPARRVR